MGIIISLILIGLILAAIELLIIPGFGLAGIAGLGSMAGAVIYTFHVYGTTAGLLVLIGILLLMLLMYVFFLKSGTWKRLTLKDSISSKVGTTPEEKGLAAGLEGITITRIGPMGTARFGNIVTEVSSRGEMIMPDTAVTITAVEDNRIFVSASSPDNMSSDNNNQNINN